jgi:tRNA nucleotidyltransferase (CCA-adding enzyme)
MALPLDARSGNTLVDLHAGLADLEARRLRVLHRASFTDDPTRVYRAARYAARLGFRLERETAALARSAVRNDSVLALSAARVLHELERLLDETASARALAQTQRLGLLEAAVPGWEVAAAGRRALRRLDRVKALAPWSEAGADRVVRACGLRLLLVGLTKRLRSRVLERLGIAGRAAQQIELDLGSHSRLLRALARAPSPGQLDAALSGSAEPALLMLYCTSPSASQRSVVRYASRLRHARVPFDGHRVRAFGARGPLVGRLLRVARRRTLDGDAVDEAWARRWLARQRQIG